MFAKRDKMNEDKEAVMFCATANLDVTTEERPWKWAKGIVDKMYKHVYGHYNFTDMNVLLERNRIWTKDVLTYLEQVLETCGTCRTTTLSKPARKVSLSSMSLEFNNVVSIDHMFLVASSVVHIMDTKKRHSVGAVVLNVLDLSIVQLNSSLFNPRWTILGSQVSAKTNLDCATSVSMDTGQASIVAVRTVCSRIVPSSYNHIEW